MGKTSNSLSNRSTGAIMLGGALLTVIAMLLHPEGILKNPSQNAVMKWVHGVIIVLIVFNAFGLGRVSNALKTKGRDTNLGMLFYYIGFGGMIAATLVSGFVQTSVPLYFSAEAESFSDFNRYSAILNQVFAKFGIISFGAAGLLLSPVFFAEKGASRLVGIVGGVVGSALIAAMLTGLYLTVLTMTIFTILIVIWHIMIAIWLVKN